MYVNESPETEATKCNGCGSFEILARRLNRKETTVYYCNLLRSYIDPFGVECPRENNQTPKRKG